MLLMLLLILWSQVGTIAVLLYICSILSGLLFILFIFIFTPLK